MNTIGFLALLYVIVSTFMWAGCNLYERRNGRTVFRRLRWMFIYAWWLVPVYHGYNVAVIRYRRRRLRLTVGRLFGEARTERVMEIIDDAVRRP